MNLVVNEQEYGNIWIDDRAGDNGIYPSKELGNTERITFLDWYELWLDHSLNEMKRKFPEQHKLLLSDQNNKLHKKPWWKLW